MTLAAGSGPGGRRTDARSGATDRRVVGIDLAGSPRRRTGYCLLTDGAHVRTWVLGTDRQILGRVRRDRPEVVVMDAPLSLPRGRRSLEARGPPHLRACDRELLRLRIRFFPLTLGPMRTLTARGIALRRKLVARGFATWEGFPGATQDLMGWPRKGRGVARLQRAVRRFGLSGDVDDRPLTHDELDAIACAWAGWELVHGRAWVLGDPDEGVMVLPSAPSGGATEGPTPRRPLRRRALAS